MRPISSLFPYLLFAGLVIAAPAMAQQDGEPASLLPDIDPQDIEIRGDFQVRFPGLSRQPILGFSPRTPVYRVDPDRMPYMESDEEIVAAIPISDLEPALKPEQQFIAFADQRQVFARTGLGTYMSPELKFIAETPIRDNESLALDIGHHSSEGDREYSSFRNLGVDLQWTRRSGNHRWGLGVTGRSSFNYSPFPMDTLSNGSIDPEQLVPQLISHSAFGIEGRWQHLEHAYRGWQTAVSVNRFGNEGERYIDETITSNETRFGIQANRFWEGGQMEQVFGLRARSSGAIYDTMDDHSQYWLTNTIGGRYRQLFGHSHQVEAWLRIYQLYDIENEFDLFLYPDIQYRYQGTGRVSAGIRVRGFVNDPSLERMNRKNRFLMLQDNDLEHERGLHIGLHSDIELGSDLKAFTGLDYWQYYNLGYFGFSEDPLSPYYAFHYTQEAIHVEWYHGATYFYPALRTSATLEAGLNFSTAAEEDISTGEIPYLPRWKVSAQFMTKPLQQLDISTWLDYRSQRKTATGEDAMDGYVQLGMQTDFRVHQNFGVYVKALNILNQDYEVWQNYQERPFQIYGGVTLHW